MALLLAGLIGISAARAAVYSFNNGDMLLGFTSSYGTGSGYDVIIDIGTPSSSALSPTGISINLGTNGAVSSIMTTLYGNTWFTNGYVSAGIFGYSTANSPNREFWGSTTTNNFNLTQYSQRVCLGDIGNDVNSLYGLYAAGAPATTYQITSGGNTYDAVSYQSGTISGWSYLDTTTPIWGGGLVNTLAHAVVGNATTSINDYYINTNSQTLLGSVNIDTAGIVTVTAVPEPSTYALMGLATLAVLIAVTRRNKLGESRS